MEEIVIPPQAGYVGLRICEAERSQQNLEYFAVELFDAAVRARTRVYAYEPTHIAAFFESIEQNWRGWPGEKSWEALEGECRMSAVADGKGHIDLTVSLRPSPNAGAWRLEGHVLIEAGQLDSVAKSMRAFVGKAG